MTADHSAVHPGGRPAQGTGAHEAAVAARSRGAR